MRRPLNKNLFLIGKLLAVGSWLGALVCCVAVMWGTPWTGIRTATVGEWAIIDGVDPGSPAEGVGLGSGDTIVSVQGERFPWQAFEPDRDMLRTWEDAVAFESSQARLDALIHRGQILSIAVRHDGKPREVKLVPTGMTVPMAIRRMLWPNLLALSWMASALLLVRKLRSVQTAVFLVGSSFIALTLTTMGFAMERELATGVQALVWIHGLNVVSGVVAALSAFSFGLVFPVRSKWASGVLDRWWILVAAALGVLVAHWLRWTPGPVYLTYGFSALGNLGFLLALGVSYATTRHVVHRRQIQWLMLGFAVGTLPYVLLTELPLLLKWPVLSQEFTSLASIAIPLTIGLAINRWKLLEISGVFDAGLIRLTAFVVLVLVELGLMELVSWYWRGTTVLPLVQSAALLAALLIWNHATNLILRRVRGARLGMDALPPLIERLIRGEPLPEALSVFLSEAYGTTVFARLGDTATYFLDADGRGARWLHEHQNPIRGTLRSQQGPMIGFELAWKLDVDIPADVENCLFVAVPSQGQIANVLVLGPRWSPDWWTRKDVDRVESLLRIALPLGKAAENWHQEEIEKRSVLERAREELETKVVERTRDVETVNQQLREALSAREDFLAQMSHELRSPLAAILGGVEAVREGLDGKPTSSMVRRLEMVERNGHHLLSLIQDILDFTRGRAGKLPVKMLACRMGSQLELALELVGPLLEQSRGGVEIVDAGLRDAVVVADPLRLRQILTNLVTNALRHGKGVVEIRLSCLENQVVVDVMDRGPGIASESMDKLFRPFERLGESRDHKASTGLGLALSRQLARSMDGELDYLPRDGGGAVFRLRLGKSDSPPTAIEVAHVKSTSSNGTGWRILVVEDQPDLLELWSLYLGSHGWKVEGAGSAEEALTKMEVGEFDALVTDLGLPGMDGSELVRCARRLPGGDRLSIMVLTGAAFPEDEERSRKAGADFYFVKPVPMADVAEKLGQSVRERNVMACRLD